MSKEKTTKQSIRDILTDMQSDNDIEKAVNRIDTMIICMLRNERLEADYRKMRYDKGLSGVVL
jgi:uncharacterized protein YpuA (DUF1002 family)